MPGIVGILDNQENGFTAQRIHSMMQPMRRQQWHTANTAETSRATFGSIQIDAEERLVKHGRVMLAWAGEIVQQADLRASLAKPPMPDQSFAMVLQRLYAEKGVRALCGLNGIYVIAVWDEIAGRLHLINDRYGLQKMYLYSRDGSFAFSSEMKSFAGPGQRISPLGAAQLLSLGYLLDEETLYRDVRLLPPASLLTVEQGQVTVERYWNHNFNNSGEATMPARSYVQGLSERAAAAVARRVRANSAIMITGGLDSRLLAGMWAAAAPDSNAVTISLGQPNAFDVLAGRDVAQALGFDFHHVPLTPAYLSNLSEQCVWITEGNMNVHASWILAANPAFGPLDIQYALTGVGGEAAAGRHIMLEAMPPTWEEGVAAFLHAQKLSYAASFLRKEIAADLVEQIRTAVRRTVQDAPAEHHLNKLDFYSYSQPLRRHATSIDVFADFAHPLDPLLDNDLIDYAQALPPKLRARGYLYKRMIRTALPDIASIGRNLRGPILRPSLEKSLSAVASLPRRAQRRVSRMAALITPPDNPRGYIYPNTWLRTGSKAFALAVFSQADRLAHLLNLDAVQKLVDNHMSGQRNDYMMLCGLMTLILWQKMFIDGNMAPLGSWEGHIAHPMETTL